MAGEDIAGYMLELPWKVVESILITVLAGAAVTLLSTGVSYIFKLKSTTLEAITSA